MPKLTKITQNNYTYNGKEIQNNLTNEDIELLLEDYIEISNIDELKPSMHIRYYIIQLDKNGKQKKLFRMGGNIIKIDHTNQYIVLTNGTLTWCVQLSNSIIYRKGNIDEIKQIYKDKIEYKNINIINQKNHIKKLESNLNKFKSINSEYNKLKEDYKKLYIKYKQK